MKFLALMPALALSASAFAATATANVKVTCTTKANGKPYAELTLDIEKGVVQELLIESYEIIKNGVKQDDRTVAREAFDVVVSKPTVTDNGVVKLTASLQDYSDQLAWDIAVAPDSKEVVVVDYLKTSDGDDMNHVSAQSLKCK